MPYQQTAYPVSVALKQWQDLPIVSATARALSKHNVIRYNINKYILRYSGSKVYWEEHGFFASITRNPVVTYQLQ